MVIYLFEQYTILLIWYKTLLPDFLLNKEDWSHHPCAASLHLIPIKFKIDLKMLLLTFNALYGLAPKYCSDLQTLIRSLQPTGICRWSPAGHR